MSWTSRRSAASSPRFRRRWRSARSPSPTAPASKASSPNPAPQQARRISPISAAGAPISKDANADRLRSLVPASATVTKAAPPRLRARAADAVERMVRTLTGRRARKDGGSASPENRFEDCKAAIAELTRAKAAAESANEAKSRFLASVSHEIRSPLNSIYGYAQLLERSNGNDAVQAARVIRRSAEHLTNLVEGLLDISRIEIGRAHV